MARWYRFGSATLFIIKFYIIIKLALFLTALLNAVKNRCKFCFRMSPPTDGIGCKLQTHYIPAADACWIFRKRFLDKSC